MECPKCNFENPNEAKFCMECGNLHDAISWEQRALELFTQIGDAKHGSWCMILMSSAFLSLGNLQKAAEYAYRGLETAESMENKREQAWAYITIGNFFLCQGSPEKATDAFRKAHELGWVRTEVSLSLGQGYLAAGKQQEALQIFQEIMPSADTLSGLEEAYDNPEAFLAFCHRFREEHPEVNESLFVQWYLEPTEAFDFPENLFHDEFNESLQSDWTWQDPFDDCSYVVQNGLEIHAANGRDLWHINLSAPRILRSVSGDFAAQTVCVPVSEEKPAIGGFLLWKDKENFLRLDKGTRGACEISFMGCIGNKDVIIGRGRLPSERVYLRIERFDNKVNALCSADGEEWFTVGNVGFPVEDPVEVGLHAIGNIDRTIYHGAYPEGTAIRFESFQLWSA